MPQTSPFTEPLISQPEINALIRTALRSQWQGASKMPQHGNMGTQLSARVGAGSDFAETRPYQVGDDPRHIDWRASARSRLPLTRTYLAELSRPLGLLIDRNASMRFGSRVRLKAAQALRMALWLATSAQNEGRETAALLHDRPLKWLPPQRGMRSLQTLITQANAPCPPIEPENSARWPESLSMLLAHLPAGSELVLISDFNGLQEQDERLLRQLGHHCEVRAVHILDPLEQHWPDSFSAHLQWGMHELTHGQQDLLNSAQQRWLSDLEAQLNQAGIGYQTLMADSDFPMQEVA